MPTLVLLTSAQRQGAYSADFDLPQTPADEAIVHLDLSPQDMIDPATVISCRLLVSRDGGSTYEVAGGGSWRGGPSTEKRGLPREWRLIMQAGQYAGLPARCEIDLPEQVLIGVRVSV